MPKIAIKSLIALLFVCFSVASCSRTEEYIDLDKDKESAVLFRFVTPAMEEILTKSVNDTEIKDVNLFFLFKGSQSVFIHRYLSGGSTSATVTLPHRDYDVYAIANYGSDLGRDASLAEIQSLVAPIPSEGSLTSRGLPMSSYQSLTVNSSASLPIVLTRKVAKIEANISVASKFSGFTVQNITLRSANSEVNYLKETTAKSTVDYPVRTHNAQQLFYVGENRQGVHMAITDQRDKNRANSPVNATYLHIEGRTSDKLISYDIFCGANNTNDFNLIGNNHYVMDITISGENEVDTRVTVTKFDITQAFNAEYEPTELARGSLLLTSTSNPSTNYTMKYTLEQGSGSVKINGTVHPANTPFNFMSAGTTSQVANIEYTQNGESPVLMTFTVEDGKGNSLVRQLSTNYLVKTAPSFVKTTNFEPNYKPGDVAVGGLTLSVASNPSTTYQMKYKILNGSGNVKIEGASYPQDTYFDFMLPGSTSRTAPIIYTQSDESDVRILFTVKDKFGREYTQDFFTMYGYHRGNVELEMVCEQYSADGALKLKPYIILKSGSRRPPADIELTIELRPEVYVSDHWEVVYHPYTETYPKIAPSFGKITVDTDYVFWQSLPPYAGSSSIPLNWRMFPNGQLDYTVTTTDPFDKCTYTLTPRLSYF